MPPIRRYVILILNLLTTGVLYAQPGFQIKLDKPEEYEERILRSERTPDKKIRMPQRLLQNTITRYNYFYNASLKLNEVIDRAKKAHRDDFSKLLSFYNYSLDKTAEDGIQLDSIIWKSNSGIALHDLRNDWTDDLYLLWGASYYFQKKFDSARILFQFINQAYAPREKDGYAKTIGSARDGNNALSISTPEKKGRIRQLVSAAPPRRNDAFLWQIRNYIAQDRLAEAASLIEALRRDPAFPSRLQEEFHEVQAWWFYRQENWDSTARHLSMALDQARGQNERARWEYLLGQLYERAGKWNESEKYYSRSIPRTTDPILEIYARLGSIRTNREGKTDAILDNIKDLKLMAKRDKYADYRDIIYFMAAQIQSQTGDWNATRELLLSSVQVPSNNLPQRNQAFEQLARICLQQKEYRKAYNFYDSIQLNDPQLPNPDSIRKTKELLGIIANQMEIIERQDSILRIIALPEEQRREFIRDLAKELRRKKGMKEEITGGTGNQTAGNTVFAGGGDNKGEWYFYNTNSRSRGLAEFQARWGNRPNSDNWRRLSALKNALQNLPGGVGITTGAAAPAGDNELSFESLYATLPLLPEQQKILHDSLQQAWFLLGKTYIQRMEDCLNGVLAMEKVTGTYPDFQPTDEALFLLYYCHRKNGDMNRAKSVLDRLEKDFPLSEKTLLIRTGKDPAIEKNKEATRMYQTIYDEFLSGSYESAFQLKKQADSIYGQHYWTPQLNYVEAVQYIRQRKDSLAISRLNHIVQFFPTSPLSKKAEVLIRVLSRRDSIEVELRELGSKNPKEKNLRDSATVKPSNRSDSTQKRNGNVRYQFDPKSPQRAVIVLQDVDDVYGTEAKNALFRFNRSNFYDQNFTLELIRLNEKQQILLVGNFPQLPAATQYLKEIRRMAPADIFPWLNAGRYRFSLIDDANLSRVRSEKSIDGYEDYLRKEQPGLLQ